MLSFGGKKKKCVIPSETQKKVKSKAKCLWAKLAETCNKNLESFGKDGSHDRPEDCETSRTSSACQLVARLNIAHR